MYQSNQTDYIVDVRPSRIVLTAWNMTREDYINMKMQEAKEDAEDVLDNYLKPFDMVVDMYYPNNMTKEEFDEFLEETGYDKKSK